MLFPLIVIFMQVKWVQRHKIASQLVNNADLIIAIEQDLALTQLLFFDNISKSAKIVQ